jgi:hypothetical protein
MATLITVYLLERSREYRATVVASDSLEREWFDAQNLEWRWVTGLECRFSALVGLGMTTEAVSIFTEVLRWLDREDEIGAAAPAVFARALKRGVPWLRE